MNTCLAGLLLSIALSCSANNAAKTTNFQNENAAVRTPSADVPKNAPLNQENSKAAVVKNENSKTLDCNDPDGYSLVVVEDPSRNIDDTVTAPKLLNIVVGDEVMTTIKIPTVADANGFSLNWAKKTKEGFEILVEYGSRLYYQKQFNFICKEGNFYLFKVKTEIRDKNDPENWDEPDKKEILIKPNQPIEKFSIFAYLAN